MWLKPPAAWLRVDSTGWMRLGCSGVLASAGCIDAGLYQEAFGEHGIEVLVPDGSDRVAFMQLLYRIKSGDRSRFIALSFARV